MRAMRTAVVMRKKKTPAADPTPSAIEDDPEMIRPDSTIGADSGNQAAIVAVIELGLSTAV